MDLDNIKKSWQETRIIPSIDEQKIERMLSNDGHSAFNSLIKYEELGRALMVVSLFLSFPLFWIYPPVLIIFAISCIFGFFWQLYKIKKLRKIDIAHQSITEISNQVHRYRKMIFNEFAIGLIWFIVIVSLLGYFEFAKSEKSPLSYIIIMSIAFASAFFIYKKLYWNNIKKLESAIKEVEDFEKGNI